MNDSFARPGEAQGRRAAGGLRQGDRQGRRCSRRFKKNGIDTLVRARGRGDARLTRDRRVRRRSDAERAGRRTAVARAAAAAARGRADRSIRPRRSTRWAAAALDARPRRPRARRQGARRRQAAAADRRRRGRRRAALCRGVAGGGGRAGRTRFWPGPLTLVLRVPARDVPDEVTAGTGTVARAGARRCALARALCRARGSARSRPPPTARASRPPRPAPRRCRAVGPAGALALDGGAWTAGALDHRRPARGRRRA